MRCQSNRLNIWVLKLIWHDEISTLGRGLVVYAVCRGGSLSSLIGPVLFRVLPIDEKYRPASPKMADRPTVFSVRYILMSIVLPVVRLPKVVTVLELALGDSEGLQSRLPARATGGPPWVERNGSWIDMHSNPTPLFASLRPIIAERVLGDHVDK